MLNRTIPGQMSDAELSRLIELAEAVPDNGIIVEVGSLYGLSSWHLAKNCRSNVTVFCIDPWRPEKWIKSEKTLQNAPPFGLTAFRHFTADCDNIVMIQGHSPWIARGWKLPIDLYFEDAVHVNPILNQNIQFWAARVRPGGVISGHDYSSSWPDVIEEVDALVDLYQADIKVVDTLWSFTKNSSGA